MGGLGGRASSTLLSELSSRQVEQDVLKVAFWQEMESCPLHDDWPGNIDPSYLNEEVLGAHQSPVPGMDSVRLWPGTFANMRCSASLDGGVRALARSNPIVLGGVSTPERRSAARVVRGTMVGKAWEAGIPRALKGVRWEVGGAVAVAVTVGVRGAAWGRVGHGRRGGWVGNEREI